MSDTLFAKTFCSQVSAFKLLITVSVYCNNLEILFNIERSKGRMGMSRGNCLFNIVLEEVWGNIMSTLNY